MGINDDNAPVVDVNSNPLNTSDGIRAFGDKIGFVSRYGAASVKAYQEAVGATAKHWPGLGDTSANPDTGVTTSDQTTAQFQELNFPSFGAAFEAGVDSVMVTHIQTPNVPESPTLPSSLSPFFVDGMLRGQMGFDGVAVTDALNAVALDAYTPEQVAKLAIAAGEDLLLEIGGFPTVEPGDFVPAYEAVLAAVQSGEISVARVNESVQRILELKWEVGLAGNPMTSLQAVEEEVGTPAHLRVARRTAQKSITLLRNRKNVLPLAEGTNDSVLSTGWGSTSTLLIADEIASHGLTAQALSTGTDPTADKVAAVVKAARALRLRGRQHVQRLGSGLRGSARPRAGPAEDEDAGDRARAGDALRHRLLPPRPGLRRGLRLPARLDQRGDRGDLRHLLADRQAAGDDHEPAEAGPGPLPVRLGQGLLAAQDCRPAALKNAPRRGDV